MKLKEITANDIDKIGNVFRDFLLHCKKELGLEKLPPIEWDTNFEKNQTSFGSFNNGTQKITVTIKDRHPNDIMRTLAHELIHYKQHLEDRIKPNSGQTGSEIENEANAMAGIIMRNFNHSHPKAFSILDESVFR
jgi:Zn-dependent peptidase ImmA (M78 family)